MSDADQFSVELGKRLRRLREAKDEVERQAGQPRVTQAAVAGSLGVQPVTYAAWEKGLRAPGAQNLRALADYFDVTTDHILGRTSGSSTEITLESDDIKWSVWPRVPSLLPGISGTDDAAQRVLSGVEVWRGLVAGNSFEQIADDLGLADDSCAERRAADLLNLEMVQVEDTVAPDEHRSQQVADRLREEFDLHARDVRVLPIPDSAEMFYRYVLLGEAARAHFKKTVREGMRVGLSGGLTVGRLVYALRPGECRNIDVYPLAASPAVDSIAYSANTLTGALCYRHANYGVRGHALSYAARRTTDGHEIDRTQSPLLLTLNRARTVNVAYMGLGHVDEHLLDRSHCPLADLLRSAETDHQELEGRGVVGDVLYHFVNARGEPPRDDLIQQIRAYICSIDLSDLQDLVHSGQSVVVVTCGKKKLGILKAVARKRYANTFIIDEELAAALIESPMQKEVRQVATAEDEVLDRDDADYWKPVTEI